MSATSDGLKQADEKLSTSQKDLEDEIHNLKKMLRESETKVTEVDDKFDNSSKQASKFEKTIKDNEKEISKLEGDLNKRSEELSNLKDELKSLKIDTKLKDKEFKEKDREIESLKSNLETKMDLINVQNDKFEKLDALLGQTKEMPRLIKQINKMMKIKGFISDKELEKLMED